MSTSNIGLEPPVSSASTRSSQGPNENKGFPSSPSRLPTRSTLRSELAVAVTRQPSFYRGVPASLVLGKLGRHLRAGPDACCDGVALYACSKPVSRLNIFLSHCWHGPAWWKSAALLGQFNAKMAAAAATTAAVAVFGMRSLVPLPRYELQRNSVLMSLADGGPEMVSMEVFNSASAYGFVYVFVVVFGQDLLELWHRFRGRPSTSVFLDKLCIHQGDAVRKQAGIQSIGAYLLTTERLLVLWDDTYLERMWCIFELAVFHALNEVGGRITFVPVSVGSMELVCSLMWCMVWPPLIHSYGLGAAQLLVESLYDLGIPVWMRGTVAAVSLTPCVVAPFTYLTRCAARDRMKVQEQLEQFSVADAKCMSPSDKNYIIRTIELLFGSTECFETVVRTDLLASLESGQGSSAYLTYPQTSRILLVVAASLVLDVWSMNDYAGEQYTSYKLGFSFGFLVHMFLHFPVLLKVIELSVTRIHLRTRSAAHELVICTLLTVSGCGLLGLWVASWRMTLKWSLPEQCCSVLMGLLGLAATFGQQWRQDRRDRHKADDKMRQSSCRLTPGDGHASATDCQQGPRAVADMNSTHGLDSTSAAACTSSCGDMSGPRAEMPDNHAGEPDDHALLQLLALCEDASVLQAAENGCHKSMVPF